MPSSPSLSTKPHHRRPSSTPTTTHHHHHHHPLFCSHHSPSATATVDLLILILVLFAGTFLLTSYFSYIFNSLSLLLPPLFPSQFPFPFVYLLGFIVSFTFVAVYFGFRSRKCHNPKCKGLKKALQFDLQIQTEECFKSSSYSSSEIDKLPWKGGSETNPDYECLRAELRKMAPPNGRAVLLFRAKCGCPLAKLVGWGPKRGRKQKKALSNVMANGDHC